MMHDLENVSDHGNKLLDEFAGTNKQLVDISSVQSNLQRDLKALTDKVHALDSSIPQVCFKIIDTSMTFCRGVLLV
jgi:hypothetical protein